MSPRFRRRDESVEAGFRRIAAEEIDAAIAIIDASGLTAAEKVHKVRRQLKALRALLRLVRPAFGRFGKENRAFRDMGRALSGARDAGVMLETFDAIARRPGGKAASHGFRLVRERLLAASEARGDDGALLVEVRAKLAETRRRAQGWRLSAHGWAALSGGLEATYGDARRAMREAIASGDAEASHEWRKGVKYHGAQARLLRRMRPGALKDNERVAARLGDLLGARHDIDLFLDTMARTPARFGDIVTVTQLAGLARLRLARLDRQAARLGAALFADRPAKLAARWGDYWKDWRD